MVDNQKKTIVIGLTGAGKSTLLNLMAGCNLYVKNGKICCNEEIFKTSQGSNSQTKDVSQFQYFIDTPGLGDTKIFDRTLNMVKLHQYVSSNITCVMIVLNYQIGSKGESVFKFLQFLLKFFKNINKLKSSAIIVVSHFKQGYDTIEEFQEKLIEIINVRSKDKSMKISENERQNLVELISYLYSNGKIIPFHCPQTGLDTKGKCWEYHQQDKINIENALSKLNAIKNDLYDLNEEMLGGETQYYINGQLCDDIRSIKDLLDKEIIKQYFEEQVIILDTEKKQRQKMEFLKQYENLKNHHEKFETYKSYLNKIKIRKELEQMKNQLIEQLDLILYVSKLIQQDTMNKILLIKGLSEITKDINNNPLNLNGYFIQSSYINLLKKEQYEENKIEFPEQLIINTTIFIADEDLNLPGIQLLIKCDHFVVTKTCNFNLKGKTGDPIQQLKAKQEDGLPGNPGFQGGDFNLIIKDSQNFRSLKNSILKVDISGGDGGKGQEGGDGLNGRDGSDGNLENVKNKKKECLVKVEDKTSQAKNIVLLNKEYYLHYKSRGENGQNGQDAYKGGQGGIKGKQGKKSILNFEGKVQNVDMIVFQTDSSKYGYHGYHGCPGKGGKNGRTAYAKYQDEYIFPTLRGKTEEFQKLHNQSEDQKNAEGVIGNVGTNLVVQTAIKVAQETAIKTASLPVAVFTTGLQVACSIISASGDAKEIDKPSYIDSGKAQDGKKPNVFNNVNQKQPPQRQSQVINCFSQNNICNWFCLNNKKCQLKKAFELKYSQKI